MRGFLIGRLVCWGSVLCWLACSSRGYAQDDFLITAPFKNSIERYDASTGAYLGAFVEAGAGGLNSPGGVAVGPDGNVYVTSRTNQVLQYDGQTGDFLSVFAEGNGLTTPNNIQFHQDYMYVGQFSSGGSGFVKRYDANTGAFIDNFLDVDFADGIEFGVDSIYVSNFTGGVSRFDLNDGSLIEEFILAGEGDLENPTALLLLDGGDLLVSSYGTNSVKRYDQNGDYIDDVILGLVQPEGLEIGPDGALYAGSYGQGVVNRYDADTFEFLNEFVDHGPVTNFFTFRTSAVPEPTMALPLIVLTVGCVMRRRRR